MADFNYFENLDESVIAGMCQQLVDEKDYQTLKYLVYHGTSDNRTRHKFTACYEKLRQLKASFGVNNMILRKVIEAVERLKPVKENELIEAIIWWKQKEQFTTNIYHRYGENMVINKYDISADVLIAPDIGYDTIDSLLNKADQIDYITLTIESGEGSFVLRISPVPHYEYTLSYDQNHDVFNPIIAYLKKVGFRKQSTTEYP
jgi:hypothetical protein